MPTFKQEASGTFSAEVGGCYHCGPNHDSPKTFDYRVYVEYGGKALDAFGFLNDNLAFDAYFESLNRVTDSCELIAQKAACFFWRQLLGRCKLIEVTIWGLKQKGVTFVLDCDPEELEEAVNATDNTLQLT